MVEGWDVITIGNISRNRYWGESDDEGVRPAICTCTLVRGEGFRLLVDPSLAEAERMAAELDRRSGLKLGEIDAVFITHEHGDHHYGLQHFPGADWLAGPEVAEAINRSGEYDKQVTPAAGSLFGVIDIIATPGHTMTSQSLLFECDGLRVVIAGDAVMTRDFWAHRQGYFNSVDFELAARTIESLERRADVVVPGHDNYFAISSVRRPG